jgi:hypothetical protein
VRERPRPEGLPLRAGRRPGPGGEAGVEEGHEQLQRQNDQEAAGIVVVVVVVVVAVVGRSGPAIGACGGAARSPGGEHHRDENAQLNGSESAHLPQRTLGDGELPVSQCAGGEPRLTSRLTAAEPQLASTPRRKNTSTSPRRKPSHQRIARDFPHRTIGPNKSRCSSTCNTAHQPQARSKKKRSSAYVPDPHTQRH